jgi:hypothetical protein
MSQESRRNYTDELKAVVGGTFENAIAVPAKKVTESPDNGCSTKRWLPQQGTSKYLDTSSGAPNPKGIDHRWFVKRSQTPFQK